MIIRNNSKKKKTPIGFVPCGFLLYYVAWVEYLYKFIKSIRKFEYNYNHFNVLLKNNKIIHRML